MESIERLQSLLKGEPVDRPPFSFWHHFGLQHMSGEAVAAVHIAFAKRFSPDFLKVMSDYPYPMREGLSIDRASDFLQLRDLRGCEGGWSHQLTALKSIRAAMRDERWIVDTIYSPWTILCRISTPELVLKVAGSRPEIIRHALEMVTQSLVNYIKEAHDYIDGIYFSLTEADYDHLNPLEHAAICKPYNLRILEAAKDLPFNILRLKGRRSYFETVKGDYAASAVSWEHFKAHPGLAKGLKTWGCPILGGLDGDNLRNATPALIANRFKQYEDEYLLKGLIIAPTGSLCTNMSPYLLEAVCAGIDNLKHSAGNTSRASFTMGMEAESFRRENRYRKARESGMNDTHMAESFRAFNAENRTFNAENRTFNAEKDEHSNSRLFDKGTDFAALASAAAENEREGEAPAVTDAEAIPEANLDGVDDVYVDDFDDAVNGDEAMVGDEAFDDDDAFDDEVDGGEPGEYADDFDGEGAGEPAAEKAQAPRHAARSGAAKDERRGARSGNYDRGRGYDKRRGGYERGRGGQGSGRSARGGQGSRYGQRDERGYGHASASNSRRAGGRGYGRSNGSGYGGREERGGAGERYRSDSGRGRGYGRDGYSRGGNERGGYGERGYGNRGERGYGNRGERGRYEREDRGGDSRRDERGNSGNGGARRVVRVRVDKQ